MLVYATPIVKINLIVIRWWVRWTLHAARRSIRVPTLSCCTTKYTTQRERFAMLNCIRPAINTPTKEFGGKLTTAANNGFLSSSWPLLFGSFTTMYINTATNTETRTENWYGDYLTDKSIRRLFCTYTKPHFRVCPSAQTNFRLVPSTRRRIRWWQWLCHT